MGRQGTVSSLRDNQHEQNSFKNLYFIDKNIGCNIKIVYLVRVKNKSVTPKFGVTNISNNMIYTCITSKFPTRLKNHTVCKLVTNEKGCVWHGRKKTWKNIKFNLFFFTKMQTQVSFHQILAKTYGAQSFKKLHQEQT